MLRSLTVKRCSTRYFAVKGFFPPARPGLNSTISNIKELLLTVSFSPLHHVGRVQYPNVEKTWCKAGCKPCYDSFYSSTDISEIKLDAHSGFLSFQHLKISDLCTDPYGEFLEFCRINEHSLLKAEKFGLDIYIQLGSQSNIHASGAQFVSDIVARHNPAHPQFRIIGKPGGRKYLNGDEFVPDFGLTPAGFSAILGPTVVGEIQFA